MLGQRVMILPQKLDYNYGVLNPIFISLFQSRERGWGECVSSEFVSLTSPRIEQTRVN